MTYQSAPTRTTPAAPRPRLLVLALCLLALSAVAGVLRTVLVLGSGQSMRDQILRALPPDRTTTPLDPQILDSVVRIAQVAVWVSLAVGLLLYAWLVWKMAVGRNWARVTYTVFAVLGLSSLGAISYSPSTSQTVFTLVGAAATIVILVLLWQRPVTRYMAAVKAGRQPPPPPGYGSGPAGPPPWQPPRHPQQAPHQAPHQAPQQPQDPEQPPTLGSAWPGPGPYGQSPGGPYRPDARPGDGPAESPPRT